MNNFLRHAPKMAANNPFGKGSSTIAKVLLGGAALLTGLANSVWSVDGGHRGVVFNRVTGVKPHVYGEGVHLRIPWFEKPTIFDVRSRPKVSRSYTGTRDLQMVDITLRVLFKPRVNALPAILSQLGTDYDERVMPSIVNETLKSVIAQFNASQLITQREQVSRRIRQYLTERSSDFNVLVDDVSITHLSFGEEYTSAVEAKQVAQQEAERARFIVDKALQDKKSTIIRAQGEAKSAALIGAALAQNPGYLELRRLDAARRIAETMSQSSNKMFLQSDSLLLNLLDSTGSANRLSK